MNKIILGDCLEELKKLPENSVDAIITDPPYGLEFMGKEWDSFKEYTDPIQKSKSKRIRYYKENGDPVYWKLPTYIPTKFKFMGENQRKKNELMENFFYIWATECLRVLKHGGFLLSFGGTRTYHRLACGIEDAGFEIRDTIMWLYGSGFPKSLNIGKQIDKIFGVERKIIGKMPYTNPKADNSIKAGSYGISGGLGDYKGERTTQDITLPATQEAKQWEGWGTALKPACEPIVVARKPLSEKNVALNVLKHGTGGINIDACRIGFSNKEDEKESKGKNQHSKYPNSVMRNPAPHGIYHQDKRPPEDYTAQGRFPANIILDEEAGKMLDEQSGELGSNSLAVRKTANSGGTGNVYTTTNDNVGNVVSIKGKGGASRFFYCAKASKSERNFGCEDLEDKESGIRSETSGQHITRRDGGDPKPAKNNHPTVKPIELMEYLIKLVTRENALVLDPFLGSGTTAIACVKLSRNFIGIEKEEEYIKIAKARIKPYLEQTKLINFKKK